MIVVYHADCADGLTAALVVKNALEDKVDSLEFMALEYTTPETLPVCFPGEEYIVVDFSFSGHSLVHHFREAKSVKVFDHHVSAIRKLTEYFNEYPLPDNVELHLDTAYSGAGLVWKHFRPSVPMPNLVMYVQDYDLYQFKRTGTREYMEALSIVPKTFEDYEEFARRSLPAIVEEGALLLRKRAADVEYHLEHHMAMGYLDGAEQYHVPIVNAPRYLRDSIGEALSKHHPFVVIYYDQGDQRHYSLRAAQGSPVDLSVLADHFGGGGHATAAGFKTGIFDPIIRFTPLNDVGFVE